MFYYIINLRDLANIGYLINSAHTREERTERLNSILNDVKDLYIDWTRNIEIDYSGTYVPIEFIYDLNQQKIKIFIF